MCLTSGQLRFEGLDATVELRVDQKFVDALPAVFPHWPHEIRADGGEPFANITMEDDRYVLSSPFMDDDKTYDDPANTLCSLIVELAWARLRENEKLLCIHGAAVEFAGRLVIFPSTRRAGKSTLTVALAASGKKVFTDDFLPLKVSDNQLFGVSSGISPRLRLPLPEQIGPTAQRYINERSMIANRQYRFVAPMKGELAFFGESAPIGNMIFLERVEGAKARIEPVSHADALTALIKQNFSRAMNAAGILKMLDFISHSAPAFRLIYDDAEPAVALLETHFQQWDIPAPVFSDDMNAALFESALDIEMSIEALNVLEGSYIQADGVTQAVSDGKRFLTGHNGKSIHYLNDGAATIWHLLEEPTSIDEAVDLLHTAFPDHPVDSIRRDVTATYTEFARNGLLKLADSNCQTPENKAILPL